MDRALVVVLLLAACSPPSAPSEHSMRCSASGHRYAEDREECLSGVDGCLVADCVAAVERARADDLDDCGTPSLEQECTARCAVETASVVRANACRATSSTFDFCDSARRDGDCPFPPPN